MQAIQSKPEILLQNICEFTILSNQVKSEAFKLWLPLYESTQSPVKLLYKCIGYYVIDRNNNNNIWNIRKQAVGYIMFLKKKRREKVKTKGCEL